MNELDLYHVLDNFPVAAYTCDQAGLITYFNRAAADLWGREPKLNDPVDRYCGSFKLFTPDGELVRHDECWMARALQTGLPYNREEISVQKPDGRMLSVLCMPTQCLTSRANFSAP